MALFIKKNHHYISPLDQCMQKHRQESLLSLSQKKEIEQCDKISQQMLYPQDKTKIDSSWQEF